MSNGPTQARTLSTNTRSPRWRGVSLALLLALSLGSPGQAVAQAAPARQRGVAIFTVHYKMYSAPRRISICTGQVETIQVWLLRYLSTSVSGFPMANDEIISGARIQGIVGNTDVGELDLNSVQTSVLRGGEPEPVALFYFVAGEPGTTTITFKVVSTGEETRFGRVSIRDVTVDVEVTPCYGAYAGAGIQNYTEKYICSLGASFRLSGYSTGTEFGVNANQQNKTKIYAFTPYTNQTTSGVFVLVDNMTSAQFGVECIIYSNGTYALTFYDQAKTEGNIVMTGGGTLVCAGVASYFPQANPQIAFRALPEGEMCLPTAWAP